MADASDFDFLELDDITLSQVAAEIEDDISLTQIASELENEYMEDLLLCQAGDRYEETSIAPMLFESHVANDSFESDYDLFRAVSFELEMFLENDDSSVNNPAKLKSEDETVECDERFKAPVSDKEIEELVSAQTNANTRKNTKWAFGVFEEWRSARARNHENIHIPELHLMNAESMNFWLQRFIMEVQKKKGGSYPPKSLYYIVCGLLRHCRDMNVNDKNFLDVKDGRFAPFRRVLDAKMKELLSQGLGTKIRRADPISDEDEEKLWANGVFGRSSSTTLQYTVFFYNCKLFGLRGRDEHRNLDCAQFEIGNDSTGKFLRFLGRNNKTFKGGLTHMKLENKDIKHYSHGGKLSHFIPVS